MVLYKQLGYSTIDEYQNDFMNNLLLTNHSFDFFVNWDKIYEKLRKNLTEISILNGLSKISEDEVEILKERFMNRGIAANNNTTLSSVDFAFLFSLYMYNSGIDSFKRETLMDYIYNIEIEYFKNGPDNIEDNAKYKSILGQTKVYRGEHYDVSPDLEFGFACLKYIGILHPNYDGHDFLKAEEQYEYLDIDGTIMRFTSLYDKKISQFPEMNEFMNNYINLLNKEAKKIKLCNGNKNV